MQASPRWPSGTRSGRDRGDCGQATPRRSLHRGDRTASSFRALRRPPLLDRPARRQRGHQARNPTSAHARGSRRPCARRRAGRFAMEPDDQPGADGSAPRANTRPCSRQHIAGASACQASPTLRNDQLRGRVRHVRCDLSTTPLRSVWSVTACSRGVSRPRRGMAVGRHSPCWASRSHVRRGPAATPRCAAGDDRTRSRTTDSQPGVAHSARSALELRAPLLPGRDRVSQRSIAFSRTLAPVPDFRRVPSVAR